MDLFKEISKEKRRKKSLGRNQRQSETKIISARIDLQKQMMISRIFNVSQEDDECTFLDAF